MNQLQQPRYKFYATLLDAFTWYLKSESEGAFQEFLDKLNRVPFSSEAADKGTAFNELVDSLILTPDDLQTGLEVYHHNGFEFPSYIVREYVEIFSSAVPQVYVERVIETKYGHVLLYGYIDELMAYLISDIKTTKSYEFGKYINNWQHRVYLYCLKENGIDTFQYTVTDFDEVYKEEYVWREDYELDLRLICEHLVRFITDHQDLITDKKLFANEEIEA